MWIKNIYESASSVLVWLGPAADNSDMVMDFLEKTGNSLIEKGLHINAFYTDPNGAEGFRKTLEVNLGMREQLRSPETGTFIDAFRALLTREYWYRTWVLQELSVAKVARIVCGDKCCSLEAFESAISIQIAFFTCALQYFVSCSDLLELAKDGTIERLCKVPVDSPAKAMLKERGRYQELYGYTRRSLLYLLVVSNLQSDADSRRRATNPKDKIYGLLGLAGDVDQLNIIPEYARSVEEIYTDVAGKILCCGGFDLLHQCNRNDQERNVPSWVPDWRLGIALTLSNCAGFSKPYRSFGPLEPVLPRIKPEDSNVLEIAGIKVDVVEAIGSALDKQNITGDANSSLPNTYQFLSQIENFCRRSASMADRVYGEPEQWLESAIWSIPVSDQESVPGASGARRRLTKAGEHRYRALVTAAKAYNVMISKPEPTYLDIGAFWEVQCSERPKYEPSVLILDIMAGRKPFITKQGYVGVGPANMQSGDLVCIFLGSGLPFLIRPLEEGRYILVGEAYVHGIVDGEFVEKNKSSEVFELV
jgi:hypothetical protein